MNMNLKSPINIKVEWKRTESSSPFTLNISAFLLNKKGIVNKMEDFVFYGNKINGVGSIVNSDNSVRCDALNIPSCFNTESAYRMTLNLDAVRPDVNHIRIIVSITSKDYSDNSSSFDCLSNAKFTLKDSEDFIYESELNHNIDPNCRCIEICLVQRYGSNWRFYEENIARIGGLELPYNEYTHHLNEYVPFSNIGDISKIEWHFEESVVVKNKNGSTFGEKITKRIKDFFLPNQPTKKEIDDFFNNTDFQTWPQHIDVEKENKDPFFQDLDSKNKAKAPPKEDFSFGNSTNVSHKTNNEQPEKDPFFIK